jgi:hypothetical protein
MPPWCSKAHCSESILRLQPIDRLSQGVVIDVATAAHRGFIPCRTPALGVENRNILIPRVQMMNQGIRALGLTIKHSLLQPIKRKMRAIRTAYTPAHNALGNHVDHKGNVLQAMLGADVGEVRHPQRFGRYALN